MKTPACSISRSDSFEGTLFRLEGVIDETVDLSPIAACSQPFVVVDLAGVTRVTSFGVREWLREFGQVKASYLCFTRCSPAIVSQLNTVRGFVQRGEVISLYVPFACPSCDDDVLQLIDLRSESVSLESLRLPEVVCPACNVEAEFDDVPEMYFGYVRSAPRPRPPLAIGTLLDGSASRRGFRVQKDVRGVVTLFHLSGYLDRGAYFRRLADGLEGQIVVLISEVTGVSADGMAGLERFANNESLRFARVPPRLISALAQIWKDDPDCPARVLSLCIPFRCIACGQELRAELTAADRDELGRPGVDRCSCGGLLDPAIPGDLLNDASLLPMVTASPEVADCLGHKSAHGQLVLNRYEIIQRIGRGGIGELFLARMHGPKRFEKLVALKRIRPDRLGQKVVERDFLREARIVATLSHRNIVQIIDFGRDADEYVIAMEYVDGLDLAEALRVSREEGRVWPADVCCRIVSDLCAALHVAHTHRGPDGHPTPIIHRDVSPSNVLIARDGTVKLADFGLARDEGTASTDPGVFKGKHDYAAPERLFRDSKMDPDERIDIFGAGAILYECLTGRPFAKAYRALLDGETLEQLLADALSDAPAGLDSMLARALALDRDNRYRSAREFQDNLETILHQRRYVTTRDLGAWIGEILKLRGDAGEVVALLDTLTTGPSKVDPT